MYESYSKILVPTDFTPKSKNALQVACDIAKVFKAEVRLFHVVEIPIDVIERANGTLEAKGPYSQPLLNNVLNSTNRKLQNLISKVKTYKVKILTQVKTDAQPEKIARIITNGEYDLLVIAGNTQYRLEEVLQHTNPERIAALAKTPALIINDNIDSFQFKVVVIPTNLKTDLSSLAEYFRCLPGKFKPRLHLVHINTPSFFKTTEEIEQLLPAIKDQFVGMKLQFHSYNARDIRKGLMTFCSKITPDCIALASWHDSRLISLFNGNITEYMINHSKTPVMTFNTRIKQTSRN